MTEQYQGKISGLEKEKREHLQSANKMTALNEELRDLVDQERNAYAEEKIRIQEEHKQELHMLDAKLKIMRNKILMLL